MSKEKRDLEYWKLNAEEDYKQVPISVLRYIAYLELAVEQEQEIIDDIKRGTYFLPREG